jgi:hypothetical protein
MGLKIKKESPDLMISALRPTTSTVNQKVGGLMGKKKYPL